MDNEKTVGAITLALLVDGLILMILQTTGVITWSWWVVLLPILLVLSAIVFLLNAIAVYAVAEIITRWVRNRRRVDDGH